MADTHNDIDGIDEYVRQRVADLIADGFADNEEIVEIVAEEEVYFDEDGSECKLSEDSLRRLRRFVRKLAAKHRRREVLWPPTTDCDRLDAAFDALRQRGVLARQYVGCDQFEGHDTMHAMVETITEPKAHGYAFYTARETYGARGDGKLFVTYDALDGTDEATVEVGRQVAEALREAGLRVEWNGDPDRRIVVTGLKWKRRRG